LTTAEEDRATKETKDKALRLFAFFLLFFSLLHSSSSQTYVWTWMHGPNEGEQTGAPIGMLIVFSIFFFSFFPGIYRLQGMGTTSTIPGSRYGSTAMSDQSGNLWLFGGFGYDSGALGLEKNNKKHAH
jgi:hypothetical protein